MPASTKRSRAAAPEKPSGFSEDAAGREEEVFAARVAVHLREFASKRRKTLGADAADAADGWTAETADAAVRAAAAMLPRDSHVRARIEACLEPFVAKVVSALISAGGDDDTVEADSKDDYETFSLDASAAEARGVARDERGSDDDFEAMSLERCVRETHRRLLVASFDAPLVLAEDVSETASKEEARRARDAVARQRAASAVSAVDAAEATARRFAEDVARAKKKAAAVSSDKNKKKSAQKSARDAFLNTEEAKRAERVVARAFALAALRRGELGSDAARAAAARAVLARHALRSAAGFSLVADTPGRDAALACGDDRVHLIRELARRVPDDAQDGEADAESALEDASETASKKKKRRRQLVGAFGVGDLPLFQAALGIGGFDERFESEQAVPDRAFVVEVWFLTLPFDSLFKTTTVNHDHQATAGSISTFAALNGVVSVGPAVLPRDRFAKENRASSRDSFVASAFRPDASLRDVVASYEKALAGDPFAEDTSDDAANAATDDSNELEEERVYLQSYFDFLKIARACIRLCVARGDRRAAEDHARFAGRVAAAPSSLLAHMPESLVATACARAASVELAACGSAAWREVVRAKAAALAALGGDDDADDDADGFFVDRGAGDGDDDGAARAAALAETLAEGDAGAALQGDALTAEEEDELAAMLRSHRAGLDEESGEDPMGDLEDEEETKKALGL